MGKQNKSSMYMKQIEVDEIIACISTSLDTLSTSSRASISLETLECLFSLLLFKYKIICPFIPTILLNFIFLIYPLSLENHKIMSDALISKFGESCYMSCSLLVNNNINSFNSMINYIWKDIDGISKFT